MSSVASLPLHTRIEQPEHISRTELDAYLARGWYRIGQVMVTCRFVWSHDRQLRSAVWTRTPVAAHQPSRNQRRLHARNAQKYKVVHGPLRPDGEHEALYRRYLKTARGERPPRLIEALFGGHVRDRFATREIAIRDGDGRLVAFSAFDVGERAMQSLMGIYDPAYASDSLGFWSLLLEVRLARELGLAYHYSGYVLPGDPSMDYKLRIAPIEFLDPDTGRWRPWRSFPTVELPVQRLERRLGEAMRALDARGQRAIIESYLPYEAPVWNPDLRRAFGHPRALLIEPKSASNTLDLIAWDLDAESYHLARCLRAAARAESRADEPPREIELWVEVERRHLGPDPNRVAEAIVQRQT